MFTLKTTDVNGNITEVVFDDRRKAAELLRDIFGPDAMKTEARYVRDTANSALRAAYHDKGGVEQFFAECRRRSEANNK